MMLKLFYTRTKNKKLGGNRNMKETKDSGISTLMLVLMVLAVIMVIIIMVNTFRKKGQENVGQVQGEVQEEEYVQELSDGSKLNKSEELQKTKKVNGLEISNIQLRETGGITTLLADVKNTTGAETEDKTVKVEILDKQGNVITKLLGPIDSMPAGGIVKLNVAVTADVANAYDFRISE